MVAQLSSKVFLGDKICRNPDWLRITVDYTVDSFVAARELRFWPTLLRPFIANFLPSCRKIQQQIQQARDIIEPVLEERRKAKEAEASTGAPRERYVDAMQWMEDSAKGAPYDPAVAQLSFSLAAIHTTSDMLNQVLVDLCGKDKLIQELREEIISVITQDGWKKTTLYKLKLMDSVLKESQRLKPISIGKWQSPQSFYSGSAYPDLSNIYPNGTHSIHETLCRNRHQTIRRNHPSQRHKPSRLQQKNVGCRFLLGPRNLRSVSLPQTPRGSRPRNLCAGRITFARTYGFRFREACVPRAVLCRQ